MRKPTNKQQRIAHVKKANVRKNHSARLRALRPRYPRQKPRTHPMHQTRRRLAPIPLPQLSIRPPAARAQAHAKTALVLKRRFFAGLIAAMPCFAPRGVAIVAVPCFAPRGVAIVAVPCFASRGVTIVAVAKHLPHCDTLLTTATRRLPCSLLFSQNYSNILASTKLFQHSCLTALTFRPFRGIIIIAL